MKGRIDDPHRCALYIPAVFINLRLHNRSAAFCPAFVKLRPSTLFEYVFRETNTLRDTEIKRAAMPGKSKIRSRLSVGAVRSEETTNAILNAAAELLEEQGYAGFTLDAVVQRAESSKPTIYRWWKNKAALIRDVYERSGEASLHVPDTGQLELDLYEHLSALWQWWNSSKSGEVLRSFITELQLRPDGLDEFRKSFLPRRQYVMRRILLRAVERGEIREGPEIENAISLLTGVSWHHLLIGDLAALDELKVMVGIVVKGLKAH